MASTSPRVVAGGRQEAGQLEQGSLVRSRDGGGGREGGIRQVDDVGWDVGGDEPGLGEGEPGRTGGEAHDTARAAAGGDEALVAEGVERGTDGRAAEGELARQGALAGQARADEQPTVADEAADPVGKTPVGRAR